MSKQDLINLGITNITPEGKIYKGTKRVPVIGMILEGKWGYGVCLYNKATKKSIRLFIKDLIPIWNN